jgi:tRNA 2-selenouridine synthase SelU
MTDYLKNKIAGKVLTHIRSMAKANGKATDGAVTCLRIGLRKRDKNYMLRYRLDFTINGNRVSAIDAAKRIDPDAFAL